VFSASDAAGITSTDISNWDTAHGWGDHGSAGYLTSETTHADVLVDGDFNSSGIMVRGSNPGDYNVIVNSSSNWNDAYGWGDHGSAGYASSTDITDLQNQIDNITGADSALDTFQELITYIRGLDSAQDLSLIQDVADLKSDSSNWDTAYSWGDHGSAGYLTSYTETDPVFSASDAAGITSTDISNWNTAHGWGDHGAAGYLTSVTASDIGLGNVNNTSDLDKPISTLTQSALDGKVDDSDVLTAVTGSNKIVTQSDISALGGGDMLSSVYDSNGDGIVNSADNASTVNNLTVETAVPAGAVFTDTVLSNITDNAQGVVVTGKVAAGQIELSFGGSIDAQGGTKDFRYGIVNFSGASVAGLGDTIDDQVDFHLNRDSAIAPDQVLSWNGTDYEWVDDHSSQGYASLTDIADLQNQITNITGADSTLDTFQELITYVRDLDSAQDLSLIQDVADLKSDSSNWDTAYGWGDHSLAGYLTSYAETSTLDDVITRGNATTTTAVIPFLYPNQASFPNATTYHGAIAHSHADGAMYFAHGGNWVKLANDSQLSNSSNWDTAYGWGDHGSVGYLTSYTETDPVFSASDAAGITSTDISNWNTAHGWGDHSLEGYSKVEISDNAPSNPTAGDLWWNSNEGNLKIYYGNDTDTAGDDIWVDASVAGYSGGSGGSSSSITDGTSSVSFDSANDVVIDTDLNVNAINISGHILPSANAQFDLGNAEYKIRHLFLSDNSIYMGSETDSAGEMLQFTKDNVERSVEVATENTAPVNENEPGNKGDMRIVEQGNPGGGYLYIHNGIRWVRSPLEESWSL